MTSRKRMHYTEYWADLTSGPLAQECETYRRVVGDLLAAGHEGKFVLVKGAEVVGLWATDREAHWEGINRFPNQPFLIHRVVEWEPVQNFGWLTFGKLLGDGDRPCPA